MKPLSPLQLTLLQLFQLYLLLIMDVIQSLQLGDPSWREGGGGVYSGMHKYYYELIT